MGISHHTAPMTMLEVLALDDHGAAALRDRVRASAAVSEVLVIATCNRLEVYAEPVTFHGAVAAIGDALAASSGLPLGILRDHLYVHHEDRAVAHAFSVASGLDSMAVGESQILAQVRTALSIAQRAGTAGDSLNTLFQQALRVAKKAHARTALGTVSCSLVDAALAQAVEVIGPIGEVTVTVVGAGAMSSLAATSVSRAGVSGLTIVNRSATAGRRVAAATGATYRPWSELTDALTGADLVISCTGAQGHVISGPVVAASRAGGRARQVYVDLALPRDVDPAVGDVAGTTVITLADLAERLASGAPGAVVQEVEDLITGEVASYLAGRMVKKVAPTVAALRTRAAEVVRAELARLDQKLPDLDPAARSELARTVHRVVEKLLHTPTIRVKELSSEGGDYAEALRELFDLDPHDVAAVSVPPERGMP